MNYKIMLFTFKAIHRLTAEFISEIIVIKKPNSILRYNIGILLQQIKVKTNFAKQSFSNASPSLWKSLPHGIIKLTKFEPFKK